MLRFILFVLLFLGQAPVYSDGSSSSNFRQSSENADQEFRANFQTNLTTLLTKAGLTSPQFVDPKKLGYQNADFAWRSSMKDDVVLGLWMNSMDADLNQKGMINLVATFAEECGGNLTDKKEKTVVGKKVTVKSLFLSCAKPGRVFHSSFITIIQGGVATVIMHESKKHDITVKKVNDNFRGILFSVYEN